MEGDQFGWSPDVGRFVRREDTIYTEHGHTYVDGDGYAFRVGSMSDTPPTDGENYADWSESKREEVIAMNRARTEKYEEEEAREVKKRNALVEQAKAKLTPEEYEAIVNFAQDWRR